MDFELEHLITGLVPVFVEEQVRRAVFFGRLKEKSAADPGETEVDLLRFAFLVGKAYIDLSVSPNGECVGFRIVGFTPGSQKSVVNNRLPVANHGIGQYDVITAPAGQSCPG